MKLYIDSSALVKLVKREAESDALRAFLRQQAGNSLVTSTLARVEVVRVIAGAGSAAVAQGRRQLTRIDQINLDRELLDTAAILASGTLLRSLDAIHLAAASSLGPALRSIVTYGTRMQEAAEQLGITVEKPM